MEGESTDLHVDAEVSASNQVDLVGWHRTKRRSGVGDKDFAGSVGDVDGHLDGAGVGIGAGAGVGGFEVGDNVIELLIQCEAEVGLDVLIVYYIDDQVASLSMWWVGHDSMRWPLVELM